MHARIVMECRICTDPEFKWMGHQLLSQEDDHYHRINFIYIYICGIIYIYAFQKNIELPVLGLKEKCRELVIVEENIS